MSNDQKYYLEATKEFDEGRLDEALWSKMLSVNQGDETKAKYSYIKHRAKELQKEASRKSFSNSLSNFKKLTKRILRPLFILTILALIIFGIIKTIDYIQTRAEEVAYQQQLKEQAAADAIAKTEREEKERIAALERAEQERIARAERAERAERERIARAERAERAERKRVEEVLQARITLTERQEKIANAYQGLDCVVRNSENETYRFFMIINPIIPKIETVYYNQDGFPKIVTGRIEDAEMTYRIYPKDKYLGKQRWKSDFIFDLNKSDLSLQGYYISNSKCTPTDHNEIRERVRKEQESIRSGYKITN